jgi:bifunctional UDP-N-acetylglucosamine pyrophosphorylase / glucosamine-1-phosphate N-acetyltransferase
VTLTGVVLAAGLGTRMSSSLPKVLHSICGVPMLQYVLNTLSALKPQKTVVIVGKHSREISQAVTYTTAVIFKQQKEAKGTGDALLTAVPVLKRFKGTVLVVNGDSPLITETTLEKFLSLHKKKKNSISLLSFVADEPGSYGRIIRDEKRKVVSIVENRDATVSQRMIREVNSGIYAFESAALHLLKNIKLNESKGEYYLTDIVGIAKEKGLKTEAFCIGLEDEFIGVNTRDELEKARNLMKGRIMKIWADRGVDFIDRNSVFISCLTMIGPGTVVYPNVHLEGKTKIGRRCIIYPNVRIKDSIIEDGAAVKDATLIENSIVKKQASVGPFAHIRPGSIVGERARIGNFVEIKKSVIGAGTKASHLSYLGDAQIGKNVNIGAGTITCNYDGYKKDITVIEDNVFIGSDTQLIAPVKVGKGVFIGAGSTITRDVPPNALALSRVEQKNIEGWALRKKPKVKSQKSGVGKGKEK